MLAAMRSIGGDGSGARLLLVEDDQPEASLAAGALSRVADVIGARPFLTSLPDTGVSEGGETI